MSSAWLSRVVCLPLLGLLGCGQAATTPSAFSALSKKGTIDATVRFDDGVKHGQNTLAITLAPHEAGGEGAALTGVEALMPTHGHRASATRVEESEGEFRAEIDLFMTGRWQVQLLLDEADGNDMVVFAADVP